MEADIEPNVEAEMESDLESEMEDDDGLVLVNDEDEIARLQLPPQEESKAVSPEEAEERTARIDFQCSSCDMHELVHYFGREPPFALGIMYPEDTYVMRDPFQAPPPLRQANPEYHIALGTKCSSCSKTVCKDPGCSIYYTATFCLPCGKGELRNWPVEAQARLRKQLSASQVDKS